MATPSSPTYAFQRASTMSTRAVIDPDNLPTTSTSAVPAGLGSEGDVPLTPVNTTASDTAEPAPSQHPQLHRRRTHNYEDALKEAAQRAEAAASGSGAAAAVTPGAGYKYRGDEVGEQQQQQARPDMGLLGRQQSWNAGDQKRAMMERMLSGGDVRAGYSTSSGVH
ncbi:hypothetical protein H2203_008530 [Taxawa tesnikishii (nom. ined.)]|nr:hypothetical protein H2203_008530 [Dothideales sp. JES 119]